MSFIWSEGGYLVLTSWMTMMSLDEGTLRWLDLCRLRSFESLYPYVVLRLDDFSRLDRLCVLFQSCRDLPSTNLRTMLYVSNQALITVDLIYLLLSSFFLAFGLLVDFTVPVVASIYVRWWDGGNQRRRLPYQLRPVRALWICCSTCMYCYCKIQCFVCTQLQYLCIVF